MHGDDYPTHILHPTMGIVYSLLYQKGQVPITASPAIINLFIYTHPYNSVSSIFLPASELNILNNPENTPDCQSSDTEPQHAVTTHNPAVTV